MDYNVKIKKQNRSSTTEELEQFSKEELITRIRSLEAHNVQLQNIISKSNSSTTTNGHNRKFNFLGCRFRHILLHVCYLGWDYQGFAVQEDTSNTIEYHLFQALLKTCLIQDRSSSNYHRCGRTDKGVSSFGQVISIDVRSKLNTEDEDELNKEIDYCKILNRVLPGNIQCIAWAPTETSFSARFSCSSRIYKYYFPMGKLNIEKMQEATKFLIGSHDFRNFAKMDVGNGVVQFVRNVLDFRIEPLSTDGEINEYSIYVAVIKGNAFLWHQIRYIMGILFLIGSNKEDPKVVKELLDVNENPRKPEYNMAREVPLNLFACEYENVHWQINQDNLKSVVERFQEMWTFQTINWKKYLNLMKKFGSNEKVIGETEAYFESKDKSFYKKRIEKLKERWNECITLKREAVMLKDIINNLSGQLDDARMLQCPSTNLVGGVKSKKYIPVMKRQKCESLDDKIEHYSKRKRIEIVPNNNDESNK